MPTGGLDIIAGAAVVGAGAAAYGASTQAGIAGTEEGIASQQAANQEWSFQSLQNLINNPNSFFSSQTYQAAANQGTLAISRQAAAQGGNNTSSTIPQGAEAQALQAYGQSFGEQQLLSQEQLLAGMSGTSSNPVSGLQAASQATQTGTSNLNALAGLGAFLGTSGMFGSGSGGVSWV